MRGRELDDLRAITQAKYEQQQQSFARIVSEENRLRTELLKLDDMRRASHQQDEDTAPMRAIGADIIWQGWIGRSKAQLNMQLAQVLAIKEHHLAQVKHAYGKVLVVQQLAEEHGQAHQKEKARAMLAQAIDQSLFG